MKVKLKDVAEAAGVSVSTVSRVINGNRDNPASPDTVEKIWAIVEAIGYVPNINAKNLVLGEEESKASLGRIGCIYTSTYDLNNDPFFSCIGLGIQKELRSQHYHMAYALSAAMMDYKELYRTIVNQPVDGIIILGRFDAQLLELFKSHFKHMVYAGVNSVDAGFDEVICDGYKGAQSALQHLLDQGHKKIGYVGYVPDRVEGDVLINEHRYSAYCDLMKGTNGNVNATYVLHTNLRTTVAYDAMMGYLTKTDRSQVPTAFYCANDATAFGVMKALQEKSFAIPEDVAVIGLDDVEMARFVTPTLSTVSIPRKSLGIQAVKMLTDHIETKRTYSMRVDLPFELKVRESTMKRPC